MKIIDVCCIEQKEQETEYLPLITEDNTHQVRVLRHNAGLEFIVDCNTDEYCWMFGDRHQDKLTKSFETALCLFIREECFEDNE